MRFETYVVVKIGIVVFWHVIPCIVLQICADGDSRHLQNRGVHLPNTHCHTATRQVTTIPLMTNQSYDQNFLKKISIQSIIVMSLQFHFKLHFELCAQSFDYRSTCYWDNIFMGATYLNPPRPVGGCIFHLSSYFQLTTRCSERILFVSCGVPVNHNLSKDLPLSHAVWNTF